MEDLKFYLLPFFGLSVSMMKMLNPYMEFGVLVLSFVSVILKIWWDYKKSR